MRWHPIGPKTYLCRPVLEDRGVSLVKFLLLSNSVCTHVGLVKMCLSCADKFLVFQGFSHQISCWGSEKDVVWVAREFCMKWFVCYICLFVCVNSLFDCLFNFMRWIFVLWNKGECICLLFVAFVCLFVFSVFYSLFDCLLNFLRWIFVLWKGECGPTERGLFVTGPVDSLLAPPLPFILSFYCQQILSFNIHSLDSLACSLLKPHKTSWTKIKFHQ